MATPAPTAARGRGRGRQGGFPCNGRPSARPRSQISRNGGLGRPWNEISPLERTARKFYHTFDGCVRREAVHGQHQDHMICVGETVPGDHEWIAVTMFDDQSVDANALWRYIREKLEAVSVLSVLATTESYAWRHNVAFWRQFSNEHEQRGRPLPQTNASPAPRDDTIMPRFLLDFSFAEITGEILTLLRHVLMGSEKLMRLSFKQAMETLTTIPSRTTRPASIPIGLRFARCRFGGDNLMKKLVEIVQTVNGARRRRHRELSTATSRVFYYEIVELDFGGVRLSVSDFHALQQVSAAAGQSVAFRLVLENTTNASTEQIVPFGAVVSSWFEPDSLLEPEGEPPSQVPNNGVGKTRISLNSSALSSHQIASLFSAVHTTGVNGSTTQLSLRGAFQCCDSSVAWGWIAFGVWSGDTSSRLVSLDLSGNVLRRDDVTVIQRVVQASTTATRTRVVYELTSGTASLPLQKTKERRRGRRQRHRRETSDSGPQERTEIAIGSWVRLASGSKLMLSTANKKIHVTITSSVVIRVVDVRSPQDGVVLVPGYGFLEVDLSATIPIEDITNDMPREHALEELKLNSMATPNEHPDAVFEALFATVSLPTLTKLDLNANPLGQNALRAVLTACPVLTSLSLEDCELQSISAIVEGYASGYCRIQSLNLAENDIGDADIVRLSRLITREASSASRLRVLNLHQNPITIRSLHALSVAIRESPNALVHLVLDKDRDPDGQLRAVFYSLQDQFLGVDPLSPAHQVEFQNALVRRLRTTALEVSIIDHIFSFAASTLYRRIVWM